MKPPVLDYQSPKSTAEKSAALLLNLWDRLGMLIVLLIIFVAAAIFVDYFFSGTNFKSLLLSVAMYGMLACTMLFCLAGGDFDLSIGAVVALGGIVAIIVSNHTHSLALAILAAGVAGAGVGAINGVIIAILGINALITTLASMQITRGLAMLATGGGPLAAQDASFYRLGMFSSLGLPNPVWLMLIFFVLFGTLLHFTIFGRNTLAIGGNPEAAKLAGVRVRQTKVMIFTIQGMVAGFVGAVMASQLGTIHPFETAQGYELTVISACVLGGVSITGGIGSVLGIIVGTLIMGTVQNIFDLRRVDPAFRYIVSGGILLSAVLLDRLKLKLAAK
jgi:L-arabinose transport system permease protein